MNCTNLSDFEKQCPNVDCKNTKCPIFRKVVIPSNMGSDEEGQPYAPENGAYENALVYYEASGVSYIYSSDGIYTKIAQISGGIGEVISVNGKKGVVTITIGELNGLTADQIVTRINSAKAEDKAYTDTKTAAAKSEAIASAKTYTDTKTAQVEAEIPTKTSDLTNDSGFQNATQVNAAIAPVSAKADATDAAINKSVVNSVGITASSSTDTLNLTDGKINIKTGTTTSETIPFPVASATSAGVMNSATYQGLVDVTDIANGLLEGAVAVTGLSDEPTQTQISNAWKTSTGRTTLMNRAVVYDVTNQKLWTYYTNTSTWYPVTAGGGSVEVQPWTNTQAGIVKGSTQDGQIFAENDGTGSVNGWDEVKTDIANLENAGYQTESQVDAKIATAKTELEAEIDEKQDELTAGENITIEDNVISATDTTYTAGDNITISNNEISADVPELLGSTGQSEVAGMTQKAITDALAGAGGGGVKVLTEDDYNWPVANPDGIAIWLLDTGFYENPNRVQTYQYSGSSSRNTKPFMITKAENYGNSTAQYMFDVNNIAVQITDSNGNNRMTTYIPYSLGISNSLTATVPDYVLDARQGKVLKDLIDSLVISGTGAPTTSTVGTVGKLYEDTTNGKLYQCTAVSGSTYTWTEVGGGGSGGGVQFTDIYADGTSKTKVHLSTDTRVVGNSSVTIGDGAYGAGTRSVSLGNNAYSPSSGSVALGPSTQATNQSALAIGDGAVAGYRGSIALGAHSGSTHITADGMMDIGTYSIYDGYNSTNYRLLTGLHDPVNDHDAATKGYVDSHSGGGGNWGSITGTLSDQTDLQSALDAKQGTLTAGTGISITNNVISATGGGGGDPVYSTVQTSNQRGDGAVYIGAKDANNTPLTDPSTTDGHRKYFWALPWDTGGAGAASNVAPPNESINIGGFQRSYNSNCTTIGYRSKVDGDGNTCFGWQTGGNTSSSYGTFVGAGAQTGVLENYQTALGYDAQSNAKTAVALGAKSTATTQGEVSIGGSNLGTDGYSGTSYRKITNVYDGENAHDAMTVGQANALIDAINTALSTNIAHIGAA